MVTDPFDALDARFEAASAAGRRVQAAGAALDAVELSTLRTDWSRRSAAPVLDAPRVVRKFASAQPLTARVARPLSAPVDPARERNLSLDVNRKDVVKQAKPSRSERLESPRCKPRPKSNRGGGGSRAFVPWCDRR